MSSRGSLQLPLVRRKICWVHLWRFSLFRPKTPEDRYIALWWVKPLNIRPILISQRWEVPSHSERRNRLKIMKFRIICTSICVSISRKGFKKMAKSKCTQSRRCTRLSPIKSFNRWPKKSRKRWNMSILWSGSQGPQMLFSHLGRIKSRFRPYLSLAWVFNKRLDRGSGRQRMTGTSSIRRSNRSSSLWTLIKIQQSSLRSWFKSLQKWSWTYRNSYKRVLRNVGLPITRNTSSSGTATSMASNNISKCKIS